MFDPRDFILLAKSLAAEGASEADVRTAISRAYYGSFLLARSQTRLDDLRGPEVHRLVLESLYRLELPHLATRLHTLRTMRNEADYDTTKTITPVSARKSIRLAELVVTGLKGHS